MNIICTSCSAQNRAIAKFCKKCGTVLNKQSSFELDDLIGMDIIKQELQQLDIVMKAHKADTGLCYDDRLHTIIMGHTGTGKTMLINAMAAIYHKHGVIKQNSPLIYDAVSVGIEKMKNRVQYLEIQIRKVRDTHIKIKKSIGALRKIQTAKSVELENHLKLYEEVIAPKEIQSLILDQRFEDYHAIAKSIIDKLGIK